MSKNQDGKTVLAHWIYTRDEWKTFLDWKKWRNGIFSYLLYRLVPQKKKRTPQVLVTNKNVLINDEPEAFSGEQRRLKRISIRDTGKINVLEIVYERPGDRHPAGEIKIPVPKGKLKEAIDVQEKLNACVE